MEKLNLQLTDEQLKNLLTTPAVIFPAIPGSQLAFTFIDNIPTVIIIPCN
jgi:hypothetical protein